MLKHATRLAGALVALWLMGSIPVAARGDPLEVLLTGKLSGMPFLTAVLKREPMTESTVIPTRIGTASSAAGVTTDLIRRYMRLYFPRTYEDLVSDYEFILMEQIDVYYFTDTQFRWMTDAIREDGLGGLQDRSVMSMHSYLSIPWSEKILSEAFPNDAPAVVSVDYHRNGPLEVILNEDPSLPGVVNAFKDVLNYQIGLWGSNLMIPREGSQIYMWAKTGQFPEFAYPEPGLFPHILGWRYGEGYTWSVQDILGAAFWYEGTNPYGTDVMMSMLMFSTGRDLPEDVVLVHELRTRFTEYSEIKGFIFSLMEFVDRFGANTDSLASDIQEMDGRWMEARDGYLGQDYSESWTVMVALLSDLEGVRADAIKLKDRALLWIYIVEWLSVLGTFLIAGFVLWTLMIRRRLYREVSSTRLLA